MNLFLKKVQNRMAENPRIIYEFPIRYAKRALNFHDFRHKLSVRRAQIKRNAVRRANNYQTPKRLLIYVIFANGQPLQAYKIYFLEKLSALAAQVKIVVNGQLTEADRTRLSEIGDVCQRENSGYDAAAFRAGILETENLDAFDELILSNDTNVGPFTDLHDLFKKMASKKLDFWGISYGDSARWDFTGYNPYGRVPKHVQSYFMVFEKSLFMAHEFHAYWAQLTDTNSRDKAIGLHETFFTQHFESLGFKHGAFLGVSYDDAMYIHPQMLLEQLACPIIKYSAFSYDETRLLWERGFEGVSEVPRLLDYLKTRTDFPFEMISEIVETIAAKKQETKILIINGSEDLSSQETVYRIYNKKEQLTSLHFLVLVRNFIRKEAQLKRRDVKAADVIVVFKMPKNTSADELFQFARENGKKIFYDLGDAAAEQIFNLSADRKNAQRYELTDFDGILAATTQEIGAQRTLSSPSQIGYMFTSLRENERRGSKTEPKKTPLTLCYSREIGENKANFALIAPALLRLLQENKKLRLYLRGFDALPDVLQPIQAQVKLIDVPDYIHFLRFLKAVDIYLAPLTDSLENQFVSEHKWLEASLQQALTVASARGSYLSAIHDGKTGVLSADDAWYATLSALTEDSKRLKKLSAAAHQFVIKNRTTLRRKDEFVEKIYDDC
ncbi:MAG: hypothetical protein LBI11_04005 [Streptococcaceae bacterium]|nr:hypothetical protein [Streptococcaceae bacterium]